MRWIAILLVLAGVGLFIYSRMQAPPHAPPQAPTPSSSAVDTLCQQDPLAFLEQCRDHYRQTVKHYSVRFKKWERDKTKKPEEYDVYFREEPFSVLMVWKKGGGLTTPSRVLYNQEQNPDQLVARVGFLTVEKKLDSPDVTSTTRYPISQFGFGKAIERTLASMYRAKEAGKLHLRCDGVVTVPELEGRPCVQITRTPYDPPEDSEGLNKLEVFIDQELKFQTGSRLYDAKGELFAEYYFTNINLDPQFHDKQFTRDSLASK